jgi:hypothetical protein
MEAPPASLGARPCILQDSGGNLPARRSNAGTDRLPGQSFEKHEEIVRRKGGEVMTFGRAVSVARAQGCGDKVPSESTVASACRRK